MKFIDTNELYHVVSIAQESARVVEACLTLKVLYTTIGPDGRGGTLTKSREEFPFKELLGKNPKLARRLLREKR